MTYEELGQEMVRLGAADAVNLDGGGSTPWSSATRGRRTGDGRIGSDGARGDHPGCDAPAPLVVANSPSDGRERSVADVLGVRVGGRPIPAIGMATRATTDRTPLPLRALAPPPADDPTRRAGERRPRRGRVGRPAQPGHGLGAVRELPARPQARRQLDDGQPAGEDFPGVDAVAVMFSWADVERRPGEYDFAAVDRAYDHWRAKGKQIQLRLSTSRCSGGRTTTAAGLGVPPFVLDKLPADRRQRRTCEGLPYDVVDARDPYYLDRLERFLAAVAAHFDRTRPITLVDLRGFGLWGEWHSGFQYATVADRRAALGGVIDRYAKAFPDRWLSLSYSYDPDSPKAFGTGRQAVRPRRSRPPTTSTSATPRSTSPWPSRTSRSAGTGPAGPSTRTSGSCARRRSGR
jgi:hypothetical protein